MPIAMTRRVRLDGTSLRFATVTMNQSGCGSRKETNLRAVFQGVAVFNWRGDHAGCNQMFELAVPALPVCNWPNKLGDNPSVGSDNDPLPRLDSPNVPAEVVLQFAYARLHRANR
jgi:hypothetical protein